MRDKSMIDAIRERVASFHAYKMPQVIDMENSKFLLEKLDAAISVLRGIRSDPGCAHWWEDIDNALAAIHLQAVSESD